MSPFDIEERDALLEELEDVVHCHGQGESPNIDRIKEMVLMCRARNVGQNVTSDNPWKSPAREEGDIRLRRQLASYDEDKAFQRFERMAEIWRFARESSIVTLPGQDVLDHAREYIDLVDQRPK